MQKVAVIGCGFMGATHMEAYQLLPNAEIAAGVDVRAETAKEISGKYGVPVHESIEAVLDDDSISIVDVCLPTDMHRECTERAVGAGKHVLCEKPMALTVEDATAMADAAESAGKYLMVAQVLRFWPEYVWAKEKIDSGELGKLQSMSCVRRSTRPEWSWESWMMRPEASGGGALDLHIHDTDWICYCFGRPRAVASTGLRSEMGWDYLYTNYYFGDAGASAESGIGYAPSFGFRAAFTAMLEGGQIEFDLALDPPLRVYRAGAEEAEHPEIAPIVEGAAAAEGGNISELGGYFLECKYFVDCVESGEEPTVVPPEDGIRAVEVCLAEVQSAETGEMVSL
ncbi:MAG: Gfo/Idh/MocA family oxidoreductase [Armatimonadota bacterium]|jgi:predicted dehydrogenase